MANEENQFAEIHDQVLDEIKKIGADTKGSYEEIRKSHEQLKSIVEEQEKNIKKNGEKDTETEVKLNKWAEDLSTRTEASEKATTERLDSLETMLQRSAGELESNGSPEALEEAKDFYISCLAISGDGLVKHRVAEEMNVSLDAINDYKNTFETYLRRESKGPFNLNPEESKLLQVGSDPDGGYTVTPAISRRIIEKIYETNPIRQLASTVSITTDAIEMPVDRDEAGSGWESETVANAVTSTPTMGIKRIPTHILAARPQITTKLLEDSGINVSAWLAGKVGEKFGRDEEIAFVLGNGVNRPRGILTYASGTSWGQIEQVNMGHASAITADGLLDIMYSLTENYMFNGTWLMNRTTVRDVMKLKDGNGQYLWRPGIQAGQPSMLIASPVRMATSMPVIAANALSVAYADWKEAYLVVNRKGITVLRDPYTAKPRVEFYTRMRVGGDITNYDAIKIGKIAA